jgi:hypothetical protein
MINDFIATGNFEIKCTTCTVMLPDEFTFLTAEMRYCTYWRKSFLVYKEYNKIFSLYTADYA